MRKLLQNLLIAWKIPRWRWALVTALLSDALAFGLVLLPPMQWLVDGVTATILFAVLGFRWPLLPALAVEVVPGIALFPAWTLVVSALAAADMNADKSKKMVNNPPEHDLPKSTKASTGFNPPGKDI